VNSKQAVIFLNGNLSRPEFIRRHIKPGSLLIACDGGLGHVLKLGLKPAAIVGDFDSGQELPPQPGAQHVKYPADKDSTDSELAIRYAIERGCKEIVITGFLGDRVDHMLGNIFLLTHPDFSGVKLKIVDAGQEIYIIRDHATIRGDVGDTISFFPLTGETIAKSGGGLKYNLSNYVLSPTGNQGISNILTAKQTNVTVERGLVMVVHQLADKNR
jgi:thiamine pyrophosphokinase